MHKTSAHPKPFAVAARSWAVRLRLVPRYPFSTEPVAVAQEVGCGRLISAPDTVPFASWCAARHLDDLPEALWATASAGGDVNTTCAMVGGVVAARPGLSLVPADWLRACEPLPDIAVAWCPVRLPSLTT